jgi:hypothetical protein
MVLFYFKLISNSFKNLILTLDSGLLIIRGHHHAESSLKSGELKMNYIYYFLWVY